MTTQARRITSLRLSLNIDLEYYRSTPQSAEPIPSRRPERHRRFIFSLLHDPLRIRLWLMSRRRRIVTRLRTRRRNIVRRALETTHILCSFTGRSHGDYGLLLWWCCCCWCCHCCRCPWRLMHHFLTLTMFMLHRGELGFAFHLRFVASRAVGVDGFFGEVVRAAAGWRGRSMEKTRLAKYYCLRSRFNLSRFVLGCRVVYSRTDAEGAPA